MLAKNKGVGRRAWSILRLVLLWARKGGLFRRRLVVDLRLFGRSGRGLDRIRSMERELSFEKTPMVHVKMHRPHSLRFVLPCINPRKTDYDYDLDLDREDYCSDEGYVGYNDAGRICCVENNLEEGPTPRALREVEAAEGIDFKAEEFIVKFYQQMKLQRQISNLGYYQTKDQSNS